MITSWDTFQPTDEGKFFSDVMHANAVSPSSATSK
jgi:hypothetical protein